MQNVYKLFTQNIRDSISEELIFIDFLIQDAGNNEFTLPKINGKAVSIVTVDSNKHFHSNDCFKV